MKQFQSVHAELMLQHTSTNETQSCPSNKKKQTKKRKQKFLTEDKTVQTQLTPKQSTWYILYILNEDDMNETELKDFRNQSKIGTPHLENFSSYLLIFETDLLFYSCTSKLSKNIYFFICAP